MDREGKAQIEKEFASSAGAAVCRDAKGCKKMPAADAFVYC